jgi:AMMECR1 domain-containing protein
MSIKISVLSPLSPMRARSWRDVHRAVRPGSDGLLVEAGRHRATLLPSVWARLPDPAQFLDVLWHKAGLRPRDWLPGTRVCRYTTEELADPGPRRLVRG